MLRNVVIATLLFCLGGAAFFGFTRLEFANQLRFLGASIEKTQEIQPLIYRSEAPVYTTDFLNQKKEEFIRDKKTFISADLTQMSIVVYVGGEQAFETAITAKGKDTTPWETPAGVYEVRLKKRDHFSSIGRVHMPWSIQFQGNFFIHGVPYYPNGKEIFSQYSAGCIRLQTVDAKKIYGMVDIDTPVIVYESLKNITESKYEFQASAVSAKQFLVADIENGYVFTSLQDLQNVPIREVTQLLTSIVATEHLVVNRNIYVDENFIVPTIKPRLESGQKFRLYDYLYLALQEASHEATYGMVRPIGTEKALVFINEKARSIGMSTSLFTDPSGITNENSASAQDVFQLARYTYYNRSFLLKVTSDTVNDTGGNGKPRFSDIENKNVFTGDPMFVGGKSILKNGNVIGGVFIFNIKFKNDIRPIVMIFFNSTDVRKDVEIVNQFIQSNFVKI